MILTTPRKTAPSATPFSPTRTSPLASPTTNPFQPSLPSPPRTPKFLTTPRHSRPHKPLPPPTTPSTRRSLFLRKLSDQREQAKLQARGGEDEIMRMICVAEQKRWAEGLERAAAGLEVVYEEEDEEEEMARMAREAEEAERAMVGNMPGESERRDSFEEMLEREGREIEELLAGMDLDLDQKMG